jgi:hypothetical protein
LREFARPSAPAGARCDLCGQGIPAEHWHLLEVTRRRFACACEACAARTDQDPLGAYRCLPERVRPLTDFYINEAEWDALGIPVGLAFFVRLHDGDRVMAMYPGAAGAVESLLDLVAWQALVAGNPILGSLRPEVEALLIDRVGSARRYYLAPIERCYALTGLVRTHWRGVAGDAAVREAIDGFFAELQSRHGAPGVARRHV